jgi:hypothetical protein
MQSELGEVREEFKADPNELARFLLGAWFLLICGCACVFLSIKSVASSNGATWLQDGILFAGGLAMIVFGRRVRRWVRSEESLRVTLCTGGFLVSYGSNEFRFAWEEIASVEEIHVRKQPPFFLVQRHDGKSFAINQLLASHERIADAIKASTDARGISWEVVQRSK